MTVADSHLTALGTDVIVAVTMFLPDPVRYTIVAVRGAPSA